MSEPLLELEFGGGEQGLRVLDDGRLEYRGDVDVDVGADGRASLRPVPLAWREQWTYTEPELAELRAAIAAADEPPLAGSYGSADGVIHADRHVWRLHIGHRVREVAIEGWPRTRVAPLERLWRLLFALHKPPGETTVWRVWTAAGPVERLVEADLAEVPVLDGVVAAVFNAEATAPEGEGERGDDGPPAGVPLVEVAFRAEGEEFDRLQVFDDGRQVELRDGGREEPAPLGPERMRAIRAALRGVRWQALPQRLGPRPSRD